MSQNSEVLEAGEKKPQMMVAIDLPNPVAMHRSATIKLEVVKDFHIATVEDANLAAEELRSITTLIKQFDDRRKEITKPLDASKKSVMELFREPLEILEQAKETIRKAIGRFQSEQERIAKEAQARLEQAAADERKRLADEAAAAVKAGKQEEAQALVEQASMMVAPVATVAPAKIAGIGSRKVWKARIVDKIAFVAHAAGVKGLLDEPRLELLALVEIDQPGLNKLAAATKGALKIPGVEFYEDSGVVARSA